MPTFVEITPDAFNTVGKSEAVRGVTKPGGDSIPDRFHHVRRPVRGIVIKDETYATIQVRQANGRPLPLFDAASITATGRGDLNSNFLIQSISEQRAEKQQIVMTFGEPYIFFFGEQPRIISVQGVLLNTEDFNWRAEWWENYDKYLRGTACVRSRSRVYLSWDDIVVEGYLLTSSAQETSTEQNYVRFEFQLFVTNYQNISNIGGSVIKAHQDTDLIPDTEFVNSLGRGSSTTLAVRAGNAPLGSLLASGFGKNSLLATLRVQASASIFTRATDRLVEIDGQISDILAEAGRFIAGRNIRVPIGFEGSAIFDDAQVALASVSAGDVIGPGRTVSLRGQLAGKSFVIEGAIEKRFAVARRTGHLYDNEDEFIARLTQPTEKPIAPELFRTQIADGDAAINETHKVFEEFGIKIEAPSEIQLMMRKAMFGIAAVGLGMNLNELRSSNGTARFVMNLL